MKISEFFNYDNISDINRQFQDFLRQIENLFDRCYFKNYDNKSVSIYSDEVFKSKEDKEEFLSYYDNMIYDEYDNDDVREDLNQSLRRFENLIKLLSLIQIHKFKPNELYERGDD